MSNQPEVDSRTQGPPAAAPRSQIHAPGRGARRVIRILLLAGLAGSLLLVCGGGLLALGTYAYVARDLPSGEQLGTVLLKQSTKIYDRNGGLLFEALDPQTGSRMVVPPEQIPTVLKQATIATEDPSFYTNWGVDPYAVARAVYYDVRYGRAAVGGSTIAQQLIKNALLSSDRTVQRKLKEAILATELTRTHSKEQILTSYLNTIYYGNRAYGIQAAAKAYFQKDVSTLNLGEASLLAGLPQAPALYDPCVDPTAALDRQDTVLRLMVKEQYITDTQAKAAAAEMATRLNGPEFDKACNTDLKVTLKAPHFVNWVQAQLENQYGPEVMYKGGLQVTTTLDPAMQAIVEEEAKKQVDALRAKGATNTAVVVLKPSTGEILSMLGSVDFYNKDIAGQVNVADRLRQPGSSIKPINYVTAFKYGWTPATPLYDLKTNFPNGGLAPYVPTDYDNKERGLVSARFALGNSLNIPAVKTLAFTSLTDKNSTGQPLAMMQTARDLGITSFDDAQGHPKPFGLALTLGGGDVKLTELTNAYAAFANLGARMPATPFLKITDADGHVILDLLGKDKPKPVCAHFDLGAPNEQPDAHGACAKSAPYAYLISSILSDNGARVAAFGPDSTLNLSRPAAVKTGTTNDYRDNWTIGYTPDLVVGVWMGNSNNAPMDVVPGSLGAAPIWHNVMERGLNDVLKAPSREFPMPAGVVQKEICIESGLLPTELCPADHRRKEFFVSGHEPTTNDTVWQHIDCGGHSSAQVYMVPLHDVRDLIPYDQILSWAAHAGWPVPPGEGGCGAPQVQQAPPANHNPNPNPPGEKHDPPKKKKGD